MDKTSVPIIFSVVVPAHNEAENLKVLLPRLMEALKPLESVEVLLVDNASSDATPAVVADFQKKHPSIRRIAEPTLGYGRAVLAGLRESSGTYIGTIRADNQEKSEDLVRMLHAIAEGSVDLYKAVRLTRTNDGLKRIIISLVFNFLFQHLFGLTSRDLNASPKVFTRRFYEAVQLESLDWFIDAEMVIKAEKLGFTVREVEIEYLPRLKGKSTVRMRHLFEFLGNMVRWHARLRHGKLLEQ